MNIVLNSENDLEFTHLLEPEMLVDTRDPDSAFGALQMFATSLALCSFSALFAYGATHGIDAEGMTLRVRWGYAQHENRIDDIELSIHWPGLPNDKQHAAERAAATCTLHRTLGQLPRLTTHVE